MADLPKKPDELTKANLEKLAAEQNTGGQPSSGGASEFDLESSKSFDAPKKLEEMSGPELKAKIREYKAGLKSDLEALNLPHGESMGEPGSPNSPEDLFDGRNAGLSDKKRNEIVAAYYKSVKTSGSTEVDPSIREHKGTTTPSEEPSKDGSPKKSK